MKKCTWKKYTASVLVAAMLAAQPMAVYADEASTASQAAYSDTEAKDINGVYERVSDKVAGMLANGELTYSETSGYLYNASGSKVDPETGAEIPDTTETETETETKAPDTETKASETETKAPETETKASETSASETETESQTGTGESETESQTGQQILKPVQQRQEQQRQDPKQNQNLSRRLRHRRQRHLGLHQIMLRHRQIQKQRSLRQLQRQAAVLSRMFPTRHPVFSRRSVIEYSIM